MSFVDHDGCYVFIFNCMLRFFMMLMDSKANYLAGSALTLDRMSGSVSDL